VFNSKQLSVAEEAIEEKNRLLNTWQSNYFQCNQELEDIKTKLNEAFETINALQLQRQLLYTQLSNFIAPPAATTTTTTTTTTTSITPSNSNATTASATTAAKDVVQATPINSPSSSTPGSRKGSESSMDYPASFQNKPGVTIVRRTSIETKALKSEDETELDCLFSDSIQASSSVDSGVTSTTVMKRDRSYANVPYLRKSSDSNSPSPSTSVSSTSRSTNSSISSTPLGGASPLSPNSMNTLRTYISQYLHATPSATTNTPTSAQSLSATTSPRTTTTTNQGLLEN